MTQPPQVIISFDMETDLGNWWTTYDGVRQGTPRLLEILDRQRVPATFLWTADAARCEPGMGRGVPERRTRGRMPHAPSRIPRRGQLRHPGPFHRTA